MCILSFRSGARGSDRILNGVTFYRRENTKHTQPCVYLAACDFSTFFTIFCSSIRKARTILRWTREGRGEQATLRRQRVAATPCGAAQDRREQRAGAAGRQRRRLSRRRKGLQQTASPRYAASPHQTGEAAPLWPPVAAASAADIRLGRPQLEGACCKAGGAHRVRTQPAQREPPYARDTVFWRLLMREYSIGRSAGICHAARSERGKCARVSGSVQRHQQRLAAAAAPSPLQWLRSQPIVGVVACPLPRDGDRLQCSSTPTEQNTPGAGSTSLDGAPRRGASSSQTHRTRGSCPSCRCSAAPACRRASSPCAPCSTWCGRTSSAGRCSGQPCRREAGRQGSASVLDVGCAGARRKAGLATWASFPLREALRRGEGRKPQSRRRRQPTGRADRADTVANTTLRLVSERREAGGVLGCRRKGETTADRVNEGRAGGRGAHLQESCEETRSPLFSAPGRCISFFSGFFR